MQTLMDEVNVRREPGGTTVELRRDLGSEPDAG
jgi:anti-sigma regulatory factor (Ser/Thr protein kinase)